MPSNRQYIHQQEGDAEVGYSTPTFSPHHDQSAYVVERAMVAVGGGAGGMVSASHHYQQPPPHSHNNHQNQNNQIAFLTTDNQFSISMPTVSGGDGGGGNGGSRSANNSGGSVGIHHHHHHNSDNPHLDHNYDNHMQSPHLLHPEALLVNSSSASAQHQQQHQQQQQRIALSAAAVEAANNFESNNNNNSNGRRDMQMLTRYGGDNIINNNNGGGDDAAMLVAAIADHDRLRQGLLSNGSSPTSPPPPLPNRNKHQHDGRGDQQQQQQHVDDEQHQFPRFEILSPYGSHEEIYNSLDGNNYNIEMRGGGASMGHNNNASAPPAIAMRNSSSGNNKGRREGKGFGKKKNNSNDEGTSAEATAANDKREEDGRRKSKASKSSSGDHSGNKTTKRAATIRNSSGKRRNGDDGDDYSTSSSHDDEESNNNMKRRTITSAERRRLEGGQEKGGRDSDAASGVSSATSSSDEDEDDEDSLLSSVSHWFHHRWYFLKAYFYDFKISTPTLAVIITTISVVLSCASVATIMSIFSTQGAEELAHTTTHVMMEKTAMRVTNVLAHADNIAASAQYGVMFRPTMLKPMDDSGSDWFIKWQTWGLMFAKGADFISQAISFNFEDGSYVGISASPAGVEPQTVTCHRVNGDGTPPLPSPAPLPFVTSYQYTYHQDSAEFISLVNTTIQFDPRRRPSYVYNMTPFTRTWSNVTIAESTQVPIIRLTFSLWNATDAFLGVGEVQLSLVTLSNLIEALRPTPNTHLVLLDRTRNVVASSVTVQMLQNTTVPSSYTLDGADMQRGCSLAMSLTDVAFNNHSRFKLCLFNAETFGYAPLLEMSRQGLYTDQDTPRDARRMKLGDCGVYHVALVNLNSVYEALDWIAVVLIPETEILAAIIDGRNIAIIVSVVLVVAVAVVTGVLMRLFLGPLTEIVFRMESAAYLREEEENNNQLNNNNTSDNSDGKNNNNDTATLDFHGIAINNSGTAPAAAAAVVDEEQNKKNQQRHQKAVAAAQKLVDKDHRTLSYLSDVSAIQQAYWEMADEVGILKGYIPEHVCEQLLEVRRLKRREEKRKRMFGVNNNRNGGGDGGGMSPYLAYSSNSSSASASRRRGKGKGDRKAKKKKQTKKKSADGGGIIRIGANNFSGDEDDENGNREMKKVRRSGHRHGVEDCEDQLSPDDEVVVSVDDEGDDEEEKEHGKSNNNNRRQRAAAATKVLLVGGDNHVDLKQKRSCGGVDGGVGLKNDHLVENHNLLTTLNTNNNRRGSLNGAGLDGGMVADFVAAAAAGSGGDQLLAFASISGDPRSHHNNKQRRSGGQDVSVSAESDPSMPQHQLHLRHGESTTTATMINTPSRGGGGGNNDSQQQQASKGTATTATTAGDGGIAAVSISTPSALDGTDNLMLLNQHNSLVSLPPPPPPQTNSINNSNNGAGGKNNTTTTAVTTTTTKENNSGSEGHHSRGSGGNNSRSSNKDNSTQHSGGSGGGGGRRRPSPNSSGGGKKAGDQQQDYDNDADNNDPASRSEAPAVQSQRASTRQAAQFALLENVSEYIEARTRPKDDGKAPLPLFTGENHLVERNVSVAVVNINHFHAYAAGTPTAKLAKDHEAVVSFIHECAKRSGGVLDTFSGDKFWVSFNATNRCEEHAVAATLFACDVANAINKEALAHQRYVAAEQQRPASMPPLPRKAPKFAAALRGVTIGVSTSRAFIGPLGTAKVRRHTLIGVAVSEAAALERQAARYPDCGVMVGGDMIPAIEGYFQYLLVDACVLPGSGGLRRRIASVKAPMLSPSRPLLPAQLMNVATSLPPTSMLTPPLSNTANANNFYPLPTANPFEGINECFNAFLEGRLEDVARRLHLVDHHVATSRTVLEHGGGIIVPDATNSNHYQQNNNNASSSASLQMRQQMQRRAQATTPSYLAIPPPQPNDSGSSSNQHNPHNQNNNNNNAALVDPPPERVLCPADCNNIAIMLQFMASVGLEMDGRQYRSPLGDLYERPQ